jgi:outer membrane lipoprotein SlyB
MPRRRLASDDGGLPWPKGAEMSRTLTLLAGACTLAIAAGCAAPTNNTPITSTYPTYPTSTYSASYGQVTNITMVDQKHTSGVGAVLGAVLGGVVGHQIGEGSGKTAATVAGAVGGAYAGNRVEQNRGTDSAPVYRVDVRFDDGHSETFNYNDVSGLRVGDRVRTEGGQLYRM